MRIDMKNGFVMRNQTLLDTKKNAEKFTMELEKKIQDSEIIGGNDDRRNSGIKDSYVRKNRFEQWNSLKCENYNEFPNQYVDKYLNEEKEEIERNEARKKEEAGKNGEAVDSEKEEEKSKTQSDIIVKPDGSRVLVMTMQMGGMESTISMEISKPTDLLNTSSNIENESDIMSGMDIGSGNAD